MLSALSEFNYLEVVVEGVLGEEEDNFTRSGQYLEKQRIFCVLRRRSQL